MTSTITKHVHDLYTGEHMNSQSHYTNTMSNEHPNTPTTNTANNDKTLT